EAITAWGGLPLRPISLHGCSTYQPNSLGAELSLTKHGFDTRKKPPFLTGGTRMFRTTRLQTMAVLAIGALLRFLAANSSVSRLADAASAPAGAAGPGEVVGKVQGAGSPIAGSTVTLYAAGDGKPTQLAQGKTGDDGTCKLDVGADKLKGSADKVLYL